MRISGVYSIRCLPNGRVYVGSSVNIRARWSMHRHLAAKNKHNSVKFQRCWNKYGEDAFEFRVLEYCDADSLVDRENFYIALFDASSSGRGLNIAPKAGSTRGVKRTPQQIEKMRQHHIGKKLTAEHRAKISEALRRRPPELISQIADANRGRTISDETKKKISEARKRTNGQRGKPLTEKQRIALHCLDGRPHPFLGRKHSDDAKRKVSLSKSAPVEQIDVFGNVVKIWPTAREAAASLSLKAADTIYRSIASGGEKTAAGYQWRYASPEPVTDRAIVS